MHNSIDSIGSAYMLKPASGFYIWLSHNVFKSEKDTDEFVFTAVVWIPFTQSALPTNFLFVEM